MNIFRRIAQAIVVAVTLTAVFAEPGLAAAPESAESLYTRALARERDLRDEASGASVAQLRAAVQVYEGVVRRYPKSGYSDNALWQAAGLAQLAFERFNQAADRRTAVRLLVHLKDQYPTSALAARAAEQLQAQSSPRMEDAPIAPLPAAARPTAPAALPAAPSEAPPLKPPVDPAAAAQAPLATIRDIKRTALPDGVRVSIEMDAESMFRYERLDNPRRVFFDLKAARTIASLQDAVLRFDDDIVREIRLGRHPRNTTRVVMDLEAVDTYSVFTLYNPFRLVVDFKRAAAAVAPKPVTPIAEGLPAQVPGRAVAIDPPRVVAAAADARAVPSAKEPVPLLSRPAAGVQPVSPAIPAANSNGQFSLARQLGLGVSRIVLDAGHGGHDPGARANGLSEKELVLDVTLRLRDLLEQQPGIEVTLTRGGDQFVELEERTAIANRHGADLFLSIHANASHNPRAHGIETYFLNFASNSEAEAVAARENSASGKTMHSLPEIVRAIALNNKIDESRDFAEMVQKAMVRRLSTRNKQLRDLGVKQAPFVVLIGAGMPSVLAEISFVTHRQEGALLKTPAYRQQIAESLFDAVLRYQRSLKGPRVVASKE